MKTPEIPVKLLIVPFTVGLIIWVIYLALKRIGLVQSKREVEEEKIEDEKAKKLIDSDYFKYDLWENFPSTSLLLSSEMAQKFAEHIQDAIGWFWDDEGSIYHVFKSINHKIQISQVSYWYSNMYDEDLLSELKENLNESELAYIWDLIAKLKG